MSLKLVDQREAAAFADHAFSLAQSLGIKTALVLADELNYEHLLDDRQTTDRIIWLARKSHECPPGRPRDLVLPIPHVKLKRMTQIRIGLYSAALQGHLDLDETVLCLSGLTGSGRLDMLLITKPNRDFPWLRQQDLERTKGIVGPKEFGRLLDLCLHFAAEGREGKPIGAIFVLGEKQRLQPYLRQLIMNPCKGHSRSLRSIHNPHFAESLREFCSLDGAIIVDRSGVVESVGTYLDVPIREIRLRPGLGARHAAAAAITHVTDAIAFAISESSGTVILFDKGNAVLELERPR